jgi:uncharacterized alpha-E superfamily protein
MLSRVANSIYWFARYIERAENTARLVDVNLQLLLDGLAKDAEGISAHWEPILRSLDAWRAYSAEHEATTSELVTDFLAFSKSNNNSIYNSVRMARENARQIRDQISTEMWEEVNRLYLFLRKQTAASVWSTSPSEFFNEVRKSSQLIQGLAVSTMPRTDAWEFLEMGKNIERADMTSRILDVKYHILLPKVEDVGGALDTAHWTTILRSCSAISYFQYSGFSEIVAWNVAQLLILSPTFPRSIRFCVRELNNALRHISGSAPGAYVNECDRLSGRLVSELDYCSIGEIFQRGLHEYIDELQLKLININRELQNTYIFSPQTSTHTGWQQQQLQQQQCLPSVVEACG